MEDLIEALLLPAVGLADSADTAEEDGAAKNQHYGPGIREAAEDMVPCNCSGDGKAEANRDNEARGKHASVDRSDKVAEKGIEHEG